MAKRINRTRRLYSKMNKRKRKTRRKNRTKILNKKGGACLGCGSRLKEYLLYDNDGILVHETPVALGQSQIREFEGLGYRVVEHKKKRK
jgi:5-methylcytosine-specific restriction endonuclease McrA